MRSGVELPAHAVLGLEELDQRMRHVGADLMAAFNGLPSPDETPAADSHLVQDICWTIAEAQRLAREYRRQLVDRRDRLAGSTTPAQGSSPQSSQDPPTPNVKPGITTEPPP